MTVTKNKTSIDTFVLSGSPTKNYDNYQAMHVGTASGNTRYAYVLIGLPFSRGSKTNVHAAKFRVWLNVQWLGTTTWTVRLITGSWTRNRTTWNNKPGVGVTTATVTKTNPAAGTMLEFDVKNMLQFISNGTAWYGFRIEASAGPKTLHGSASVENFRPELEIDWSDAPDAPSVLSPSQGRAFSVQYPVFQGDFHDLSGSTEIGGMQVQVDAAGTDVGGVDWDSGMVAVDSPEIITNPADPAYVALPAWAGVAADAVTYWRCKVEDMAGAESDWSEWTQITRKTKGTLTITSPGTTTSDASFTAAWTFTGRTQKAFAVILRDLNGKIIHNSGKITSTDLFYPIPTSVVLADNQSYEIEVQVWDDIDRTPIANDTAYVSAKKVFTFDYDPTVNPVYALGATKNLTRPGVVLKWKDDTVPDTVDIYRDNVRVLSIIGGELLVSGVDYEWSDNLASAWEQHTWKVVHVTNGKGAAASPTITFTPRLLAPWIGDDQGGLYIFNGEKQISKGSSEELVQFVGNFSSIVVTTGERGYEGAITGGRITPESAPGQTMKQIKTTMERLFANPGSKREIHIVDEVFYGYLYASDPEPMVDAEGVSYGVSFSFGENI